MNAENAHPDTGLLAPEPSDVPEAVVDVSALEVAVLDSAAAEAAAADDALLSADDAEPDDADDADDDDADDEAAAAADGAAAAAPATGTMSAERLATKALEQRLLGGERKLRRREVAAGAGLSLLSARKLWRALGFPNLGDEDVAFTERDQAALSTVVDLVRAGKLTEEAAISVTRAIGQMTDRMVVWQIEALVEDMVHQQGVTDAVAR